MTIDTIFRREIIFKFCQQNTWKNKEKKRKREPKNQTFYVKMFDFVGIYGKIEDRKNK